MRGRKPTPTALKLLAGNPGKRKIEEGEPQGVVGVPDPPEHLTEEEKAAWAYFGEQLKNAGLLTNLDAIAFELLCRAYVRAKDAAAKVAQYGAVWIEKGDSKIPKFAYSPHWAVQNREEQKLMSLLSEFGLTPSSRTRVKVEEAIGKTNDKSRFFKSS